MTTKEDIKNVVISNVLDLHYELVGSKVGDLRIEGEYDQLTLQSEIPESKDLVIFNNSFMYRDIVTTKKNEKYTGILGDTAIRENIVVASGIKANKTHLKISSKSTNFPETISIEESIENEIMNLGSIIFILIGSIDYSQKFIVPLKNKFSSLTNLEWDYKLIDEYDNQSPILVLNPKFHTWKIVDKLSSEFNLSNDEQTNLTKEIDNSRKEIVLPLIIPNEKTNLEETFLDNIIHSFQKEVSGYEQSLINWQKNKDDNADFTNILRISYNFADDAFNLVRLILSICDLKPIISWMTLKPQYDLFNTFSNLDWQKTGKPSFKVYRKIIHEARNSRFHKLFNISNTIEVNLEGISLNAKSLRFFTEHKPASSAQPSFDYEDNQLIELLLNLTRTEEKIVTDSFWEQNLQIMNSTLALISAFTDSLKLLRTL